jgi:hypothetical protein
LNEQKKTLPVLGCRCLSHHLQLVFSCRSTSSTPRLPATTYTELDSFGVRALISDGESLMSALSQIADFLSGPWPWSALCQKRTWRRWDGASGRLYAGCYLAHKPWRGSGEVSRARPRTNIRPILRSRRTRDVPRPRIGIDTLTHRSGSDGATLAQCRQSPTPATASRQM